MKRISLLMFILIVSAILLNACQPAKPADEQTEEPFKVALLTPGSIADKGWNETAYAALKAYTDKNGMQFSQVETKSQSDIQEALYNYAKDGYDVVFGHGYEYVQPAAKVADEYPDTFFVISGGDIYKPNMTGVYLDAQESRYLAGILAASMSKTGKIGWIGAMDIPTISKTGAGFKAGALSVNPDIEVVVTYIGSWDDVALAKETAISQMDAGIDFINHNCDAAGNGILQAVEEKAKAGEQVYTFGSFTDQSSLAPDVVLVSLIEDIGTVYTQTIDLIRAGKFKGEPLYFGIKDDVLPLVWNDKLKDKVPQDVLDKMREAEQKIIKGELKVPDSF